MSIPEDLYSKANKIPSPFRSLQGANVDARLKERDAEACGMYPGWNPKDFEIRQRYNNAFCLPGQATRTKTQDDIV